MATSSPCIGNGFAVPLPWQGTGQSNVCYAPKGTACSFPMGGGATGMYGYNFGLIQPSDMALWAKGCLATAPSYYACGPIGLTVGGAWYSTNKPGQSNEQTCWAERSDLNPGFACVGGAGGICPATFQNYNLNGVRQIAGSNKDDVPVYGSVALAQTQKWHDVVAYAASHAEPNCQCNSHCGCTDCIIPNGMINPDDGTSMNGRCWSTLGPDLQRWAKVGCCLGDGNYQLDNHPNPCNPNNKGKDSMQMKASDYLPGSSTCPSIVQEFCAAGDNVGSNSACYNYCLNPGTHQGWCDVAMAKWCSNPVNATDLKCSCFGVGSLTTPLEVCFNPQCSNLGYHTSAMRSQELACPSVCEQVIQFSGNNGPIVMTGNNFTQKCDFSNNKASCIVDGYGLSTPWVSVADYNTKNPGKVVCFAPPGTQCSNSSGNDMLGSMDFTDMNSTDLVKWAAKCNVTLNGNTSKCTSCDPPTPAGCTGCKTPTPGTHWYESPIFLSVVGIVIIIALVIWARKPPKK